MSRRLAGHKGVRIVKSGSVELYLDVSTDGFNATLAPCGGRRVAYYFFESEVDSEVTSVIVAERAFDAEEVDLGHSLAMWPVLPQKRHRLLSSRRFLSSGVSFPSFPSLSERSGSFLPEEPEFAEVDEGLGLDEAEVEDFLSEDAGGFLALSGVLSGCLPEAEFS